MNPVTISRRIAKLPQVAVRLPFAPADDRAPARRPAVIQQSHSAREP